MRFLEILIVKSIQHARQFAGGLGALGVGCWNRFTGGLPSSSTRIDSFKQQWNHVVYIYTHLCIRDTPKQALIDLPTYVSEVILSRL